MNILTQSSKEEISSPPHPSRFSISSLIDPGSSSDHQTDALAETNAIGVDHPPVEIFTEPSPNLPPVSVTVPAMPRQMVSVGIPGQEPQTPLTVSITLRSRSSSLIVALLANVSIHPSPVSLFQSAHNVYMPHATITVAENVGIF